MILDLANALADFLLAFRYRHYKMPILSYERWKLEGDGIKSRRAYMTRRNFGEYDFLIYIYHYKDKHGNEWYSTNADPTRSFIDPKGCCFFASTCKTFVNGYETIS